MVRINLINPEALSDQHLIAEYNEILMLLGYVRKHSDSDSFIPERYTLGKGHIKFFRNKLGYLKRRHGLIRKEMSSRGFRTDVSVDLEGFNLSLVQDWTPDEADKTLIRKRIIEKLRMKDGFYRYNGKVVPIESLVMRIESSE